MSPPASPQPSVRTMRIGAAVAAVVVATLALAAYIARPAASLLIFGADGAATAADTERTAKAFASNLDKYRARFDGRSIFFDPPPPRREPPPIVGGPTESRPPSAPVSYGGPRIVAMFGDKVWFSDGRRLRVGDEPDNGLKVVSFDAPWNARVEWRGVEFTVDFFPRDHVVVKPPAPDAPTAPAAADEAQASPQTGTQPDKPAEQPAEKARAAADPPSPNRTEPSGSPATNQARSEQE